VKAAYLAWFIVLAGPPAAYFVFAILLKRWPGAIAATMVASAVLIAIVVGFSTYGIALISAPANVVCISIAYMAYCFLIAAFWKFRSSVVHTVLLLIAAIPIGIGYLMGTVGFLGLLWIVSQYADTPKQTVQMTDTLWCRVKTWGSAASDSGYAVHLYERWPGVPFVEREVVTISIVETIPDALPAGADCSDALEAYETRHSPQ
jgi:hypothetical protein